MLIQDYLNQCDEELDPYYEQKQKEHNEIADYLFWMVAVAAGCACVWAGAEIVKFLMHI